MSKSALNAMGKSLAFDLSKLGVDVGIYHPGHVRTGEQSFVNFVPKLAFQRYQFFRYDWPKRGNKP